MKVTFKKLGAIKNAELELKDLTLIAGQNNTGKTYLTYSLYGLLRDWGEYCALTGSSGPDGRSWIETLVEKGSVSIPVERILASFDKTLKFLSQEYSRHIPDLFNDQEGQLKSAKVELSVAKPARLETSRTITVNIGEIHKIQGKIERGSLHVTWTGEAERNPPTFVVKQIFDQIVRDLVFLDLFPKPFISVAERLGISLFYKELDVTKNVIVDALQRLKKDGDPRSVLNPFELIEKMSAWYAGPIKDSIQFTRAIGQMAGNNRDSAFKAVTDKIKDMMGGYYKPVDKEIRFVSKARKENRFDIPLYLGSSSVRCLTDIYFFLTRQAKAGMIMLIDEPESHLSPANQIEMARLFALCVNAGLKVFITTHSDYLVKEFNNLIMLSRDFEGKDDFLKKNRCYTKDTYLKPGSVAAYVCGDGTLQRCDVDRFGMNIPSFDDTIDSINRVADELIELIEDDHHGLS